MDYEIKANKYSYELLLRSVLVILLTLLANEAGIFIIEDGLVRKGVIITSLLWLVIIFIVKKVGFDKKCIKYMLVLSLITGIYILYTYISYHVLVVLGLPFIIAAQYSSKKFMAVVYIYSVCCMLVTILINYKYGLIDMNMVGFTRTSISYYGEQAIFDIKPMTWEIKGKLLLFFGTSRAAILSLYVFIANAIVKNASEIMQLQSKTEQESKIDAMTRLNNKNEYLRAIRTDFEDKNHVGIMYIDINGLKEINDKYGHEKGDELIINLSKSIIYMLEEDIEGYRVGGDEFVIIMENASGARLMAFQTRWLDVLDRINDELEPEYRVKAASGYAYGKGKAILDIIEEADNNMYECKKKMKGEI